MTVPTITLNGTKKSVLIDDICEARSKLYDAFKALQNCNPHPRDYQLSKDGDYGRARQEQLDRLSRLQTVYDELEEWVVQIDEANPDAR